MHGSFNSLGVVSPPACLSQTDKFRFVPSLSSGKWRKDTISTRSPASFITRAQNFSSGPESTEPESTEIPLSEWNVCSFVGNTGRDLEVRQLQNGSRVANTSIAVYNG